MHFMSGRSAAW